LFANPLAEALEDDPSDFVPGFLDVLLLDFEDPNKPLLFLAEDFAELLKDFEKDLLPPNDLALLASTPIDEVITNTNIRTIDNTLFFTNIPHIFNQNLKRL
jgi:hypothetical protein